MAVKELKDIRALIIDEKGHGISLLRSILIHLGVKDTVALRSTEEALQTMRDSKFDVVFCDELAAPLNPATFVKTLRRDLATQDVTISVILVSAGANRTQIELARDAGTNGVLVKPVSAETVERKLRQLFFEPRAFVTAKTFMGPDRRRSGEQRQGAERRGQSAGDANVFVRAPRIRSEDPD